VVRVRFPSPAPSRKPWKQGFLSFYGRLWKLRKPPFGTGSSPIPCAGGLPAGLRRFLSRPSKRRWSASREGEPAKTSLAAGGGACGIRLGLRPTKLRAVSNSTSSIRGRAASSGASSKTSASPQPSPSKLVVRVRFPSPTFPTGRSTGPNAPGRRAYDGGLAATGPTRTDCGSRHPEDLSRAETKLSGSVTLTRSKSTHGPALVSTSPQ
jgi:hypothetical protein